MKKLKIVSSLVLALSLVFTMTACGGNSGEEDQNADQQTDENASEETEAEGAKEGNPINVVSREEGSGTRGAFVEITGVQKDDQDRTKADAAIQNSTDQVTTYVAGDPDSIGYISLGSLNDTVKALKINGVEATKENVLNDKYELKRPFNIAYKAEAMDNEVVKDFTNYIMSKEGQAMAEDAGVLAKNNEAEPYEASGKLKGEIRIQGSTSVTPYMEKLMEAYQKVQPDVKFDFTSNGSGAGIQAVIDGNADIGMASREIKDEEAKEGVENTVIAIDGIAVIVSPENKVDDMTLDEVRDIYTGDITNWSEIGK